MLRVQSRHDVIKGGFPPFTIPSRLKLVKSPFSGIRSVSLKSSSPFILSSLWVVGQVGQIRLEKFVARTQQDVAAAVQSLAAEGAQEYVLDLRNNLGGLVEEGVEVARLFLDGNSSTAVLSSMKGRGR